MNTLEDQLRDAYRAAAETVQPGSIRGLRDHAPAPAQPARRTGHRSMRRSKPLAAAAAAAAVAVIAVVAAAVVPDVLPARQPAGHAMSPGERHGRSAPAGQAGAYPAFFVAVNPDQGSLSVRSAATGAQVAPIRPPKTSLTFTAAGTGDGRTFVVAAQPTGQCHSRLYHFQLKPDGQPTALVPLTVPGLAGLVVSGDIAVSSNGQMMAYAETSCADPSGPAPSDLAVTNFVTGQTRTWAYPGQADLFYLSMSANGHLLGYSIAQTKLFAAVARVLATDAEPGTAAERSRTVARGAQFGPSIDIAADVIGADGSTVYFTTNATGSALGAQHPATWQLRAADLSTGQSRVLATYTGLPYNMTADPSGRYLLIESQLGPAMQTPQLARVDIATGKVTYLQAAWIGGNQAAGLAW